MRILFVCSGAEPGADGVGDYCRRLVSEISRHGHHAALLAINDRHLEEGTISTEGELRISHHEIWKKRLSSAKEFIGKFRPDICSLQFVNYGFEPHGLPVKLATGLKTLSSSISWHIMFHELWIEPSKDISNQFLSCLQKTLIVNLNRILQPKVVHTSNPYYLSRLQSAGVRCGELPLFGNIPLLPCPSRPHSGEWVFIIFGSLRQGWSHEPLLRYIDEARAYAGKATCRFISVGRLGQTGDKIWECMKRRPYSNFSFEKFGEVPASLISYQLQQSDFGIAVTPYHLLGKSGAVAAMWEHGLPVIVNRQKIGISSFQTLESEYKTELRRTTILLDEMFAANLVSARRSACREVIADVADTFLHSLAQSV